MPIARKKERMLKRQTTRLLMPTSRVATAMQFLQSAVSKVPMRQRIELISRAEGNLMPAMLNVDLPEAFRSGHASTATENQQKSAPYTVLSRIGANNRVAVAEHGKRDREVS
jgi:hypothetical protein